MEKIQRNISLSRFFCIEIFYRGTFEFKLPKTSSESGPVRFAIYADIDTSKTNATLNRMELLVFPLLYWFVIENSKEVVSLLSISSFSLEILLMMFTVKMEFVGNISIIHGKRYMLLVLSW